MSADPSALPRDSGSVDGQGTATGKRVRQRKSTQIRLSDEVHERLKVAAADREVSMNWIVNRAVADYLDRLIPADEIRWTR